MQITTKLFSVHDSKAAAFRNCFTADTSGLAIRMFEAAARDENTEFNKHSADFTLFEVGSFNLATGELIPLDHPINHGTASSFLEVK